MFTLDVGGNTEEVLTFYFGRTLTVGDIGGFLHHKRVDGGPLVLVKLTLVARVVQRNCAFSAPDGHFSPEYIQAVRSVVQAMPKLDTVQFVAKAGCEWQMQHTNAGVFKYLFACVPAAHNYFELFDVTRAAEEGFGGCLMYLARAEGLSNVAVCTSMLGVSYTRFTTLNSRLTSATQFFVYVLRMFEPLFKRIMGMRSRLDRSSYSLQDGRQVLHYHAGQDVDEMDVFFHSTSFLGSQCPASA